MVPVSFCGVGGVAKFWVLWDLGCATEFRVQGSERVESDGGLWALIAAHGVWAFLLPPLRLKS